MRFLFAICIFLLPLFAQAQQSSSQLAFTYYNNKEYDKAAETFLQLYQRTRSSQYLNYHIISLINDNQYDKVVELLKNLLKKDENNKEMIINLGYVYEQQGKAKKAEECYEKAIKKMIPHASDIKNLAYKFQNIREYDWVIQTYTQGRKLLKKPNAFLKELGESYMMARNFDQMLTLFIQLLKQTPTEINNVTSNLSFARSYDIMNSADTIIEQKLAELFQQDDYNPIFEELSVWYSLQKKKHKEALEHAILLNQKSKNKEHIFMNIARDANGTSDYIIAEQAYNKVLERGKDSNNYYITARKEILECQYQKALQARADKNIYMQISTSCKEFLQEYKYTTENVNLAILLSDIYAYQLHLPDSSDHILKKTIAIPRLNINTSSLLKSKRADLLTFINNPWEATILYTQIEKSNPNNEIAYEAKLKKAQLAYYVGDLKWAKAQFDILKGSTTKLISNNAIRMSHFINMNMEEESENKDLKKLATTEYLIHKQDIKKALPILDSIIENSSAGIADYASLQKAKVLQQNAEYIKAATLFQKIITQSTQTYIQAEAIFELGNLKKQTKKFAEAQELYKTLVSEYTGSVYSVEAGKLYRKLEKLEKENLNNVN